ncbi:MAG TPA: hypothetical protein VIG86_02260 [Candidatus Dormibacteraeota bacterium]
MAEDAADRLVARAIESVLDQVPGSIDSAVPEAGTAKLQPWAETAAPLGRNKRPLDELLVELGERVAADPDARATLPRTRHPALAFFDRFGRGGRGQPGADPGPPAEQGGGRRRRRRRGGGRLGGQAVVAEAPAQAANPPGERQPSSGKRRRRGRGGGGGGAAGGPTASQGGQPGQPRPAPSGGRRRRGRRGRGGGGAPPPPSG